MLNTLICLLVGVIGFTSGIAASWLWARRHAAAAPAAVSAAPTSTLELHLVLNALNRVVLALGPDERTQDGVADLADYLRASDELRRRPSLNAMLQAVSSYWRMSRWIHGRPSDSLHIDSQTPELSPATLDRLCIELTQSIRDLESSPQANVSARLTMDETAGAGRIAVIQIAVAGVPEPHQLNLAASSRGWNRSAAQLSLRQEVDATA